MKLLSAIKRLSDYDSRHVTYLLPRINIFKYRLREGGGKLKAKFMELLARNQTNNDQAHAEILKMLERAKGEWQYSLRLLAETTDNELIDYVIYLVKANETRYRYFLKLAKQENLAVNWFEA